MNRVTLVTDIFIVVVGAVVAGFTAFFGILIWNETMAASGGGLGGMFTTYGYVSIEVTFLCLILVGAYFVLRVGLRSHNDEEDWELIESEG